MELENRTELNQCSGCQYHRSLSNKKPGVRIPGGFGKCIRLGGHCNPDRPNLGIGLKWETVGDDRSIHGGGM